MRTLLWICALLAGLASCTRQHYTIIKNVDVFDGKQVLEGVNLVFTEKGIEDISEKERRYPHATVIEGSGNTVLPPLINAHVHVRSPDNLREALDAGIFAVLDMFSTDNRANYLRQFNDSLAYAKFYSSNVGATPPGGHGTQFGVEIPIVTDSLTPQQFVRDRLQQNADYIKITHESSMAKLDPRQLRQVIEETQAQKKVAVVHISDLQAALESVGQNANGLAHAWYRKHSIADEADLATFREKGTFVIPTLSVISKLLKYAAENGLEENYLTQQELYDEIRKMHSWGLPILAGTDSPNFNMDYSLQYFEELLLLRKCGLSEIEVLQSATTNIYEAFGLEEFEPLAAHGPSSFILVEGKPHLELADIKNRKRIWKNGVELI